MSDLRNWLAVRWHLIRVAFGWTQCPNWTPYYEMTLDCQRGAGHGGRHKTVRVHALGRSRISWPQ